MGLNFCCTTNSHTCKSATNSHTFESVTNFSKTNLLHFLWIQTILSILSHTCFFEKNSRTFKSTTISHTFKRATNSHTADIQAHSQLLQGTFDELDGENFKTKYH